MSEIGDIRIVMCETSHPGNIGAAARAMKNMGLSQMILVSPKQYPNAVATERAAGADDILQKAKVVSSLEEAIADCELIIGTSARPREIQWPVLTAKQCAEKVCEFPKKEKVAIIFGTERSGLTNEALAMCHYHLIIPANPNYESLNLSQAIQIISYEIFQYFNERCERITSEPAKARLANLEEVNGVFEHLIQVMQEVGFIEPKPTRILMMRLKRMILRAKLEIEEVHILRGIFKAVIQKASPK